MTDKPGQASKAKRADAHVSKAVNPARASAAAAPLFGKAGQAMRRPRTTGKRRFCAGEPGGLACLSRSLAVAGLS